MQDVNHLDVVIPDSGRVFIEASVSVGGASSVTITCDDEAVAVETFADDGWVHHARPFALIKGEPGATVRVRLAVVGTRHEPPAPTLIASR